MSTLAYAVTPEHALGYIAVQLPGATAVFRRLKLDFCCGGQARLADAVAEKGLDLPSVLTELSRLERHHEAPAPQSTSALIDHILSRYHEVHRAQLPELIRMATRVEAVHRDHPDVPNGLAQLLQDMEQDLRSHMEKEEAVLFPLLRRGGQGWASQPIQMMRGEHTEHGQTLDALLVLTHDATPPEGACNTWRALYAGIDQLRDDLIEHIHLENNLLFPPFETRAKGGRCGSAGGDCGCSGSA